MAYRWKIFEYLDRGESAIGRWLREEDITGRDRGQLVSKMDMLALHGMDLLPGLLAGPVASKKKRDKVQSHIYKLVIHGQRMLRPMLCRGPIDPNAEFTMLIGAIEIGGILNVDIADAEMRRQEIIASPLDTRRINGRYS